MKRKFEEEEPADASEEDYDSQEDETLDHPSVLRRPSTPESKFQQRQGELHRKIQIAEEQLSRLLVIERLAEKRSRIVTRPKRVEISIRLQEQFIPIFRSFGS